MHFTLPFEKNAKLSQAAEGLTYTLNVELLNCSLINLFPARSINKLPKRSNNKQEKKILKHQYILGYIIGITSTLCLYITKYMETFKWKFVVK